MTEWKTLELKKMDNGFGAMIPCKDVSLGLMKYYVQGFNGQNDPVAKSGARNKPFSVAVTQQISGEAPACRTRIPRAVRGYGRCPPDFPAAEERRSRGRRLLEERGPREQLVQRREVRRKKNTGDDCATDSECTSGTCSSGKCAGKKTEGEECDSDEDCDSNRCKDSKCTRRGQREGAEALDWHRRAAGHHLHAGRQ